MPTQLMMDVEQDFLIQMRNQRVFDINDSKEKIRELKKHGDRYLVEVGLELLWVKHNIRHGQFLYFLEQVEINPRTAERYMQAGFRFIEHYRLERKNKGHSIQLAWKELASKSTLDDEFELDREVLWGNTQREKRDKRRVFLPVASNLHVYDMTVLWRMIFLFLQYLGTIFIREDETTPHSKRQVVRILGILQEHITELLTKLEEEAEREVSSRIQVPRHKVFGGQLRGGRKFKLANLWCEICGEPHKGYELQEGWYAGKISEDRTLASSIICPKCVRTILHQKEVVSG